MTTEARTLAIAGAALGGQHCMAFSYDGKLRTLEVHAVGASTKDGAAVIRGYQIAGESSRPLPCWALFRAEDIIDPEVTETTSHAPRLTEGFNPDGDKQMSDIFVKVAA